MEINSNRQVPVADSEHADDYFVELCALSFTGTLTPTEWQRLEVHLSQCASCRAIKTEYERTIATTLPAMASSRPDIDDGESPDPYSIEKGEAALFERIERENIKPDHEAPSVESPSRSRAVLFGALAATLLVGCTYGGYRLGALRNDRSRAAKPSIERQRLIPPPAALDARGPSKIPEAATDPKLIQRLSESERRIKGIESEEAILEDQRQSLVAQLNERDSKLNEALQQRTNLEQQLNLERADTQTLNAKLDQATKELAARSPSTDTLQTRVGTLQNELADKDRLIASQEDLLQHDRDIRNLMGARDLYIGEIYDVAKSGKTQKPFGRVFYTQGISLVFYAYDLDQQPGVKLASTFQAWGRREIDQARDVSLGIFYQDDQNKKRWILKSNDGATLSRLDAVFVTVEPHGESSRPTGKPLLFTYLRLAPNHP